MRKIKLNPINYVLEEIRNNFNNNPLKSEKIELLKSKKRIVFKDIVSKIAVPEFRKSTVDGYAIKVSKYPIKLDLIESTQIGKIYDIKVDDFTCVYVPTGGMVPDGAEAVVKIEETEIDKNIVNIKKNYNNNENIIEIGDDLNYGDIIIKKGEILSNFNIGALASVGMDMITVVKKPKIIIISTGDEIIDKGAIKLGQVRDINTKTLSLLADDFQMDVVETHLINDDYDKIYKKVLESIDKCDILILSGGSSVGKRDFTYDIINEIGSVITDGISLKPGKPTIVGKFKNKPIIGIPGHPVSAIMVFKIIISEILNTWNYKTPTDIKQEGILLDAISPAIGRDTYQMVSIVWDKNVPYIKKTSGKSGMISLLTNSMGYVIIPKEVKVIKANTKVIYYKFYN